jgi:hypothetical protein
MTEDQVWDPYADVPPPEEPPEDPYDETVALPLTDSTVVADKPLPSLPQEFWDARKVHTQIRTAAWARVQIPDVAFYAVLTRLAAMVDHHTKVDSGIAGPAPLNLMVAAVGSSGEGKSQSVEVASELLPDELVPVDWDLHTDLPLGSGEGIAEAYMGTKSEDINSERSKTVRCQVRHNIHFYVDEGATLNALISGRKGSTLGPTLRSAWNGATLGSTNATEDRTRLVKKGTYTFGMVVGHQPTTAIELIRDSETGMAQRFLFASANDPLIPDARVRWPGELALKPGTLTCPSIIDMHIDIKDELYRESLQRKRGVYSLAQLDGQMPLMLVKIAALLAILDSRRLVTVEDWVLAKTVWNTSKAVRDELLRRASREAEKEMEERQERSVKRRVAEEVAVSQIPVDVERVAKKIANYVTEAEYLTNRQVKDKIAGRDREYRPAAITYAVEKGWVVLRDAGLAKPEKVASMNRR